jgi:CheY-like chemotaxis protein
MSAGVICFLIDDDEDDREIFSIALQDADLTITLHTAINGKDALDKLNAQSDFNPDIIFLDLNMPLMGGKQFLQEIKNNPSLSRIPVIIYTTSSNPRDIEETRKLGAGHYLVKPSNIDLLSKILTRLLRKEELPFTINL